MPRKAVFLDRDWTLIEDPGYLRRVEDVRLLDGAAQAMRRLAEAGYLLVVVTNQAGVAKGFLTEPQLAEIHEEMRRQFAGLGAPLDAIYYCPHSLEGTVAPYACDCPDRKPNPGMLLRAARELDIDLGASWMVGDGPRDVGAGKAAGCRTVRIQLPPALAHHYRPSDEQLHGPADFTVTGMTGAAEVILGKPTA